MSIVKTSLSGRAKILNLPETRMYTCVKNPHSFALNLQILHMAFGYWESRGIPGPKPVPILGTVLPLITKVQNHLLKMKMRNIFLRLLLAR